MTPNTTLPALDRKFAGFKVSVPAVFAEGDSLTADAAKWINSQLATVLGNAFGGSIRRSGTTPADPQATFDEIFANYTFSGTTRGPSASPLTARIKRIATAVVTAKLKAKGVKVSDVRALKVSVDGEEISKFDLLVEDYIELKQDALAAQAQAELDAEAAIASDDFDLDMDALEPTEPSVEPEG